MIDADRYHSYDETDACAFGHCSSQKHRSLEKLRCRTNHNTHFAERENRINGAMNFWNQVRHHLRKFSGILKSILSCI